MLRKCLIHTKIQVKLPLSLLMLTKSFLQDCVCLDNINGESESYVHHCGSVAINEESDGRYTYTRYCSFLPLNFVIPSNSRY